MRIMRSLVLSQVVSPFRPFAAAGTLSRTALLSTISSTLPNRPLNTIIIADASDKANTSLYKNENINVLTTINSISDIASLPSTSPPIDCIYASPLSTQDDSNLLSTLLSTLPQQPPVPWIHVRSAGVEHVLTHDFSKPNPTPNNVVIDHPSLMSNARGVFSSTLAEYCMGAIFHFSKDLPRLLKNKKNREYDRYAVGEIRGTKLGIVGYGDIGRSCARLARAYGMEIVGLRRSPQQGYAYEDENLLSRIYGPASIKEMVRDCDYVLVATPLTPATRNLVDASVFAAMKETAVIINLGRGACVDEVEMVKALEEGRIKGAALDVFTVEPLPQDSALWRLDNVLLSPHNMDMTETFTREAAEFFVEELVEGRWVKGLPIEVNLVRKEKGY